MKNRIMASAILFFTLTAAAANAKPRLIGMKRATEIASSHAPGLVLKAKELEKEKGLWIYSFQFKTAGGSIREINVNAVTGKIVGIENENPRKEAKKERNEKH